MPKVSVIIPFFQNDSGILFRALKSVTSQHIPNGWVVDVIVIDDGSPRPAVDEVQGIQSMAPFDIRIVTQQNGGAGAARNRGLELAETSATLIAFLDSDDIWPSNHLSRAIEAMDEGFDFYFTDNRRAGHHESHCRSGYVTEMDSFLESSTQKTGFLGIPRDLMIGLTLKEFPCQASTVVFKQESAIGLRFDVSLRSSGEDVLFFASLLSLSTRVCFDLDSMVECGAGVNIYFANLGWDSERLLSIKVDALVTHRRIGERLNLSSRNNEWNDLRVATCRSELAFHMLRNVFKKPTRVLREIKRLARMAPEAALVLPVDMTRVSLGRVLARSSKKREG